MALGIASFRNRSYWSCRTTSVCPAQAAAQNEAAVSNYKHQLKVRERNWDRERFRYNRSLVQYKGQLKENASAAQRAYAGEQTKLNNIYKQASFKNQANLVQLVQEYWEDGCIWCYW